MRSGPAEQWGHKGVSFTQDERQVKQSQKSQKKTQPEPAAGAHNVAALGQGCCVGSLRAKHVRPCVVDVCEGECIPSHWT